MVAIVTGFNNNVIGNFQAFGASRIEFKKYRDRFGPPGPQTEEERRRRNLTVEDVEAIRKPARKRRRSPPVGYFDEQIHVKNGNLDANSPYVLGADEYYPTATAYGIALGRFFTPAEAEHSALVTVLGADVREAIFPAEYPVGEDVASMGCRIAWSASSKRKENSSATHRTTKS